MKLIFRYSTYTLNNFLDDLRNIYRRAGRLGQGIVFLLTDNDIKDDQFLEYLNNVLSSGEVARFYSPNEYEQSSVSGFGIDQS